MKLTLESCSMIYVGSLQKAIRKIINRDYPDSSEDEVYRLTEDELNKFVVNDQTFEYTAIKNKLGGYRWFFTCPKCNSRVSKLFLPPKDTGREYSYRCKECHKLKNQSAIMGQNKIYKKVTRPMKRMDEIARKLERGYLNSEKVQAMLDEYDELEKNLKSTPEYRLYTFKKRRGIKI